MKNKLSKNKVRFLTFICILIVSLIYLCFIQRWTGAVAVNPSDIEKLSCLNTENLEEFIKNIIENYDGDKILPESEDYKKAYESDVFKREITVDNAFKCMQIDYTFTDSRYSNVKIYVAPKQVVCDLISEDSDSYLNLDDSTDFYFTLQNNKYDSVETLKRLLSEEIGKNRLIYDRFAKQGTASNVNYYISPQTTNSRKTYHYMFPNKRLERTVYSVFEVGNYSISIREIITFNDESRYGIALNDFANLLQETQNYNQVTVL